MARTDNLTNYLTDVADAIREKKGTTDVIPANTFDEEIKNIQTGIIPVGTIDITKNGTHDVTNYENANVQVSGGGDVSEYFESELNSINNNGETSGGWRYLVKKLSDFTIPSSATSMRYFFTGFKGKTIPYIDTSNVAIASEMFRGCENITTIQELDGSKFNDIQNMFGVSSFIDDMTKLVNFGGLKNLGQAYLTTQSANYSNYTLNLSACINLSHDSLMNVINGLYDIASAGVQPQNLQLGSTNLAKLTEDEIAIATNKGWTVS